MSKVTRVSSGLLAIFAALLISVTSVAAADAQKPDISPEKRALIDEFMEVSNARRTMDTMVEQITDQLTKMMAAQNPGKGDEIRSVLYKHFNAVFPKYREDIIKSYYIIYDRYLSVDDLKGIVKFYKSPAGQNLVKVTPSISKEAMQVGMVAGQQAAREALQDAKQELQEHGIKTPI